MATETTAEIAEFVEQEMGHSVHPSSDRTRIVDIIDRTHKTIISGGGELNLDNKGKAVRRPVVFPWAISQDPIVQNFPAPIETGTIAATQSSTSATFSSGPAASVANWHIKIGNDSEIYRISAHTGGGTGATLDGAYIEDTVTIASYKLFKLIHTFSSSIMIPISPIRIYDSNSQDFTVDLVDLNEMLEQYPLANVMAGMPELAGIRYQGDGTLVVQFSHYPSEIERMELDFIPIPTELDTSTPVNPIIPKHHRMVLAHLASYYMLRTTDDDRARGHLRDAKLLFDALVTESKQIYSGNDEWFAYISPLPGKVRKRSRRIGAPVDSY